MRERPAGCYPVPRTLADNVMTQYMNRIVPIIVIAAAVALAGCGRKGALIPPEALVPASVSQLQVHQQGADIRISWQAPAKEQSGRPLRDLAGFRLLRRDLNAVGGDCSACSDAWKLLATIDPALLGETHKSGPAFIHFDRQRPVGSVSQYRLVAVSTSGGSSQPATGPVVHVQPPVAAPTITAQLLADGIGISFAFTPPAGTTLRGYQLYRRQEGEAAPLLPLNPAPIPTATWEDRHLQYDRRYRYTATALVTVGSEPVESLPSPEVELRFTLPELR